MNAVLLLHDNARLHTSLYTREATAALGWTVLPHPAYSSDYHPFGPLKDGLHGVHFENDDNAVTKVRDKKLHIVSIQRLVQRWQKCIAVDGHYVENQLRICHI